LIDAALEAGLNKLGIRSYEQIAAWKQADVLRVSAALGLARRISRENWIEQAQVLAKGGETYFAIRRARGEAASAEPTPDEGERRTIAPAAAHPRPSTGGAAGVAAEVAIATAATQLAPAAASASAPDVSGRAAFAAAASAPADRSMPAPAVPMRPAAPPARDNLLRISGIDAEVEKLLTGQGVTRYSQIAHWSPADVARFEQQLGSTGRIGRENWIEQAQILSRGGDTKFSLAYDRAQGGAAAAPAPRPVKLADAIQEQSSKGGARSDLGALRSVRSEIYQNAEAGTDAAQRGGVQSKMLRSANLDDLKRIRGIGVLIEKKLNSMGVVAYEQIANWTADDIERVSQSLDFKGRIERENWVEQARILASGGATEFSRRVDKGEVETSRYKT
jgi:predicted flap endonuclease-1-like 5' DNA nuclease